MRGVMMTGKLLFYHLLRLLGSVLFEGNPIMLPTALLRIGRSPRLTLLKPEMGHSPLEAAGSVSYLLLTLWWPVPVKPDGRLGG